MSENHIFSLQTLRARAAFDGGFAEQPETAYRPDVTAWAIMALDGDSGSAGLIQAARDRLVASQSSDGRIAVSPDHSNAFWPTAPAVLAWCGSPAHGKAMARAASFLAQTGGRTWAKAPDAPFAHDPTIPGWSWVENTFSWVEPTALALLALETAGYGQHSRMADGVRLLMDRQLPEGGWNYGNTLVYDQQLRPQPDNTGIALTALALKVEQADIQPSLDWLTWQQGRLRTPRSLSWAIMGLGAWGQRPVEARVLIRECLKRQASHGAFDTSLLALLGLAFRAENGAIPFPASGDHGHAT